MDIVEERTIALSAIFQCCCLVQSLARRGESDSAEEAVLIKSIGILDALNTPAIYSGLSGVNTGLSCVAKGILTTSSTDQLELLRYATQVLTLQRGLYKEQTNFEQFASEIERLSAYSEVEMTQACSSIYQTYVSPLRPQIIVQGEQEFLQQKNIPERIRTLLLAAIRAAVLWQQKGGSRFRLLWERTRMQNAARKMLQDAEIH